MNNKSSYMDRLGRTIKLTDQEYKEYPNNSKLTKIDLGNIEVKQATKKKVVKRKQVTHKEDN